VHRFLALALLAGCAAAADPTVTDFDGSMVTIVQPRSTPQKDAAALAAKTCGRHATQLSKICTDTSCTEERLIYWCR
jgi:hypothetical protein